MLLGTLYWCKIGCILFYFMMTEHIMMTEAGHEQDDLLLKCSVLLQSISNSHPDFDRAIRKSSRHTGRLQQIFYGGSRKRDPYSHVKYLIQQGGLLCEMVRVFAMFRADRMEDVDTIKSAICTLPPAAMLESNEISDIEKRHCNLNTFLTIWNSLVQDIKNNENPLLDAFNMHESTIRQEYDSLDITVQTFETITVAQIFDLIDIMEFLANELIVLLPLYPILAFRLDDSSSESSYTTSAYDSSLTDVIEKSTLSLDGETSVQGAVAKEKQKKALAKRTENILTELLTTERLYIEKLVLMKNYQTVALDHIKDQKLSKIENKIVHDMFPCVDSILDFHLTLYKDLQIHKKQVQQWALLFGSFRQIQNAYHQWIRNLDAVNISEQTKELSLFTNHDLNEMIPFDASPNGMYAMRLQPLQRICRYPLLLKELHKEFADYDDGKYLELGHSLIYRFAQDLNESKRLGELQALRHQLHTTGQLGVLATTDLLVGIGKGFFRRMEDDVLQTWKGITFYLFNDRIILYHEVSIADTSMPGTKSKIRPTLFRNPTYTTPKDVNLTNKKNYRPVSDDVGRKSNKFSVLKRSYSSLRRTKSKNASNLPMNANDFQNLVIYLNHIVRIYRLDLTSFRIMTNAVDILSINENDCAANKLFVHEKRRGQEQEWIDLHFQDKEQTDVFYRHCNALLHPELKKDMANKMCSVQLVYAYNGRTGEQDQFWLLLDSSVQTYLGLCHNLHLEGYKSPALNKESFKLKYTDENDDLISIVTDEDVLIMMEYVEDIMHQHSERNFLRIHISI
jgi:hypothetical protein